MKNSIELKTDYCALERQTFDPNQTEFPSPAHQYIWQLAQNIIPFETSTADIADTDLLHGLRQVYDCMGDYFSLMYENPALYLGTAVNMLGHADGNYYPIFAEHFIHGIVKPAVEGAFVSAKANWTDYTSPLELSGNDWVVSETVSTDFIESLAALAPLGMAYEKIGRKIIIKNTRYPLFFKYALLFAERWELRKKYFRHVYRFLTCDFSIFPRKRKPAGSTRKVPKLPPEGKLEIYRDKFSAYLQGVCDVPDTFPVAQAYLYGVTEPDFCAAFVRLKDIVLRMYEDLADDPERLITSKDGIASPKLDSIFKLLFFIGYTGKVDGDTLVADRNAFMSAFIQFYKKGMSSALCLADVKVVNIAPVPSEHQDKFYAKENRARCSIFSGHMVLLSPTATKK